MEAVKTSLDPATQTLLAEGDSELERLCRRIDRWFFRSEVRQRLRRYLRALLAPVGRRNGWQMAEQIGERDPSGVQRLVREAQWGADAVRDDLRAYVVEQMGTPGGILIPDETGFLKKGTHSVGVARHYSGTAGRVENCQVGVFLAYTSEKGTALIDRELYLPKEWAEDRDRCERAGVPESVEFATKPELARRMIERALEAGVPCAWVTGDEVYGNSTPLRAALEQRRQPYVLAVASTTTVWANLGEGPEAVSAAEIAQRLPETAWERISIGEGAKGPRLYDWAWVPPPSPESGETPAWSHRLLLRRSRSDPVEYAFYFVSSPADVGLGTAARVAGSRWAIEGALEGAKQEGGLDEYEVRRWEGWYRYITLSMLASAFLGVVRSRLAEGAVPPLPEGTAPGDQKGGLSPDRSAGPRDPRCRGVASPHRSGDPTTVGTTALDEDSPSRSYAAVVLLASETPSSREAIPLSPATTPLSSLSAAVVLGNSEF